MGERHSQTRTHTHRAEHQYSTTPHKHTQHTASLIEFSLLPPAYVVRREGNVLTRVCPSICLSTGRGSVQPEGRCQSSWGGCQSSWGGQSSRGGVSQPGRGSAKIGQQNEYSLHGGAVCHLRSHRRTFFFQVNSNRLFIKLARK